MVFEKQILAAVCVRECKYLKNIFIYVIILNDKSYC